MKKRTIALILAAAMMVLAAGCQKEEATRVAPVNSVRTVEYSIDNNRQHVTVKGTAEWQALLGECLDRAAEGHLVNISHGAGANYAKERRMYSTDSRDAALAWVDARFNEGYDVTMWYDEEESKYICVASKLAPPTGGDTVNYGHIPLEDYLQGGWRSCTDYMAAFTSDAGWASLDSGLYSLTDMTVHDIYAIVPGNTVDANFPEQTWGVSGSTLKMTRVFPAGTINTVGQYSILSPYRIFHEYYDLNNPSGLGPNGEYPYMCGFLLYEWSQDTMMVFPMDYYNPGESHLLNVIPKLMVRDNNVVY